VSDLNPQATQMADESMVRNLAAQADAIWPQERPLFLRYPTPERILDAGCGTGEITRRLAELFPRARLLGVDIVDAHLAHAAARAATLGDRVRFEHRSVYDLGLPAASFDLTVCRHVLQAIPHAELVLAELVRVTRPGGRLHLIAEDYGMFHLPARERDPDDFWHRGPPAFGAATGTDMFIGRHAYTMLRRLGLRDITVDYVVVDTLRVARETFAAIFAAWRDGYAEAIGQHTPISSGEARAYFDDMIATIRDPEGYAVWQVPVVSGVTPDR
jgi:ubiquinone/menaquinone biosynthesis C-methylase UbiE